MTTQPQAQPSTLIVGSGLIGTSIALALKAEERTVYLADRDPGVLATAISLGAGVSLPAGVEPDLIVVAVPPASVASVAARHLAKFPQAIVTDVASVKSQPLEKLRKLTDDHARFVGGHPMGGREVAGPRGARADLFEDRQWVITASDENSPEAVAAVEELAGLCGAIVVHRTPEAHDRAVALTSHTPQIVSSALAAQLVDAHAEDVEVSGSGLRDTTRLADSNPELWTEILVANASEVATAVAAMRDQLDDVVQALHVLDSDVATTSTAWAGEAIREVLVQGNAGRIKLPGKHGGQHREYELIPVVVADKPGELARLFSLAGEHNVNLEDVRIEHTVGRRTALIELSVAPDAAATLRDALLNGGWTVRG